MTLVAGPVEQMYTQADAGSQHPSSGEVMLRGQMTMTGNGNGNGSSMPGMSIGGSAMPGTSTSGNASGPARHLEVHICTLSGTVVSDANPVIRLRDSSAGGAAVNVPIAVMQGVMSGASDLHYGNNVSMTPGHSYAAEVTVNGATATFQIPAS